MALLSKHAAVLPDAPSLRFVLSWETDANDVDLHVHDRSGQHAFYEAKRLRSGGRLYADVTNGYGPECFAFEGKASAGPYKVQAHYFNRGPMGYGLGTLQVLRHDGHGKLTFEDHPFVIIGDGEFVEIATVRGS